MNTKLWNNLYKGSERYGKAVETFKTELEDPIEGYDALSKMIAEFSEENETWESISGGILQIEANYFFQGFDAPEEMAHEWYEDFVDRFVLRRCYLDEEDRLLVDESPSGIQIGADQFREKNSTMADLSVFLYFLHPFFKPMLCPWNFSFIVRAFEVLEIEFPPYPHSKDYRGFMLWYYDFCEALNAFQAENGFTDEETCACLYDFSEMLMEDAAEEPLPKPVNVWLTGASKEDYKELEAGLQTGIWQCNENTRRGDIVVVYAVSPNSCLHSIWRASSEGSFNPFNYRQARSRLTDRVDIPHISLQEMKDDPVFGKLPMLNNNLQGVNGKRLPAWAYQRLLEMIGEKGGDLSAVPVLYEARGWDPGEIRLEKDVEEKILIPCLRDLGYTERDWTRQLRQKAGRSEKAIPDFVFFPHGEAHAEVAPLVIEAKLKMSSERERMEAYKQARSYAKMLDAGILGICDEERLVLFERNSRKEFDYTRPRFEAHWAAIAGDVEVHDRLMGLIGADAIRRK